MNASNNMYTLYRKLEISCAHHLQDSEYLTTKKCLLPHGHNYIIEITIKAIQLHGGMIVDFGKVKDIINKLDHTDLNDIMENPTAENLALDLFIKIERELSSYTGLEVKVWETQDTYVSYAE